MKIVQISIQNKIIIMDTDEISYIDSVESSSSGIWFNVYLKNHDHINIYLSNCVNKYEMLDKYRSDIINNWAGGSKITEIKHLK